MIDEPKDGKWPPEKWARALGQTPLQRQIDGTKQPRPIWQYAAASVLHGWPDHAYHEAGPIMLTEKDYLAALEAATKLQLCEDGKHHYVPHPGALSPRCPHFKNYPGKCPPKPVTVKE